MGSITTLVDDLDNSITEGVSEIQFGFDGKQYTIDLGEKNRTRFQEMMNEFIASAQMVVASAPTLKVTKPAPGKNPETAKKREWAAKNGIELPARGRFPQTFETRYAQAMAAEKAAARTSAAVEAATTIEPAAETTSAESASEVVEPNMETANLDEVLKTESTRANKRAPKPSAPKVTATA